MAKQPAKKKGPRQVLDEAIEAYYTHKLGETFRADGFSLIISGEDMAADGKHTWYETVHANRQSAHACEGLARRLVRDVVTKHG